MANASIVEPSHHCEDGRFVPAILRCVCGAYITLSDGLDNCCFECPRVYNMSGQLVLHSRDPRVEEPYWDDY